MDEVTICWGCRTGGCDVKVILRTGAVGSVEGVRDSYNLVHAEVASNGRCEDMSELSESLILVGCFGNVDAR